MHRDGGCRRRQSSATARRTSGTVDRHAERFGRLRSQPRTACAAARQRATAMHGITGIIAANFALTGTRPISHARDDSEDTQTLRFVVNTAVRSSSNCDHQSCLPICFCPGFGAIINHGRRRGVPDPHMSGCAVEPHDALRDGVAKECTKECSPCCSSAVGCGWRVESIDISLYNCTKIYAAICIGLSQCCGRAQWRWYLPLRFDRETLLVTLHPQ